MTKSRYGNPVLEYQGYRYCSTTANKVKKDKKRWQCIHGGGSQKQVHCLAKLTTTMDGLTVLDVFGTHIHKPLCTGRLEDEKVKVHYSSMTNDLFIDPALNDSPTDKRLQMVFGKYGRKTCRILEYEGLRYYIKRTNLTTKEWACIYNGKGRHVHCNGRLLTNLDGSTLLRVSGKHVHEDAGHLKDEKVKVQHSSMTKEPLINPFLDDQK